MSATQIRAHNVTVRSTYALESGDEDMCSLNLIFKSKSLINKFKFQILFVRLVASVNQTRPNDIIASMIACAIGHVAVSHGQTAASICAADKSTCQAAHLNSEKKTCNSFSRLLD